MSCRALVPFGLLFFSSVTPSSAIELPDVVSPLMQAVRFVTGLIPFVGHDDKDPPADPAESGAAEADARQVIGTVRFAYDNFVLIYTPVKSSVPAGTRVTTVGKDGTPSGVELAMSSERKGAFLVADVVSGEPRAGELVVTIPGQKGGTVAEYQVLD